MSFRVHLSTQIFREFYLSHHTGLYSILYVESVISLYPIVVFTIWQMHVCFSIVRSSIFPTDLPITVPNLLAFILPRVQFELQVHFALTTCKEKCQQRNFISLKNFTDYVEKKIRHLRISSLDSSNRREFLLPLKR